MNLFHNFHFQTPIPKSHFWFQQLKFSRYFSKKMSKAIQFYSFATPNGQKISIFLEEANIPYEPHTINLHVGEQFCDE